MSGERVFYHLCQPLLEVGSVILPGNWGRLKNIYVSDPLNYREYVLERYRMDHCPEKPSRLKCVFACPTAEEAEQFRNMNQNFYTSTLYRVAPVDPDAAIHYANYNFPLAGDNMMERVEQMVRNYWTETPTEFIEALIPCPVRVLGVAT